SGGTVPGSSGDVKEFRSPLDGQIATLAVKEGDSVTSGQTIASLTPDQATVKDALRALAYVGTTEDLPLIETYTENTASDIKQSATEAAKSIRSRGANRSE